MKYLKKWLVLSASFFVWCASAQAVTPDKALPAFVGGGLRELVNAFDNGDPRLATQLKVHITSANGDPLVMIRLAEGTDFAAALPGLAAAGFRLQTHSSINPSLIEGFLPLNATRAVAAQPAVKAMHSVQRPVTHAGSVQSQAVAFEKADLAQARGLDGSGIRLGVLSDSFDTCTACSTHAADDVKTGDLPVVTVVQDFPDGTDEGRAMLQLVHDIAPGASLLFATADNGELSFSENILALRELFHSDILVDDVIYFAEPMYSDGLIAQAVDIVKRDGGAYFSSAGNNGLEAYEAVYEPISFADAQKMETKGKINLKLEQIPANIRPDTVHNFRNVDGSPSITQTISPFAGLNVISFQWDEPFNLGKVLTNYNIYVFDVNGNWMDPNSPNFPGFYSTDDNTQTDQPFEVVALAPFAGEIHGGANVSDYQIIIGKVGDGPARHIKYVNINGLAVSQREGKPSTWGHGAARGARSVAAVDWTIPNFPEDFSSAGPVTIYLDQNGNRLREPEIRFKPEIAAADGVSTTFFGTFFGTSAAAPDAAAVGALALQAAGGSGHLKPEKLYNILQNTASPIPLPLDRNFSGAIAGPVTFFAQNSWVRWSRYFNIDVLPTEHSVQSITFDATATNLTWSKNPNRFNVGDSVGIAATDITASPVTNPSIFTLNFAPGSLTGGDSFRFGMSVFNPAEGTTEMDPDRFRGMLVTTTLDNGVTFSSRVIAGPPVRINNTTGFGLVNAELATIKAAKHDDGD